MEGQVRTRLGAPQSGYSLGIVASAGRLVFISGQVAMDPQGNALSPGSVEGQARHAFASMQSLLEDAGGSLDNVVKITTFVTDMTRYAEFAKVRNEVFKAPNPASSTVQVSGLFKPELLIEIEAIAVIP